MELRQIPHLGAILRLGEELHGLVARRRSDGLIKAVLKCKFRNKIPLDRSKQGWINKIE